MSILENIMTNIYRTNVRTTESGNDSKDVRTLSPEEAAKLEKAALIRELMPDSGTPVRGEVLDLRMNSVILKLMSGETINARTEKPLPLSIGDTADFLVSSNDGKVVTLKLASGEESESDAKINRMIESTLRSSNIPVNERSMNVAKELINHSRSVSEANIRKYLMLSHKFPEADIKELLLMDMNGIEINKENVSLLKDFNQNAARIVPELAHATEELSEAISEIKDPDVKEALMKELASIEDDVLARSESLSQESTSKNTPIKDSAPIKEPAPVKEPSPIKETDTLKENVSSLSGVEKKPEQPTSPALNSSDVPEQNSLFGDKTGIAIPPKDFSREAVKNVYSRLKNVSEKLEKLKEKVIEQKTTEAVKQALSKPEDGGSGRVLPHTNNVTSTMKFVDTLNAVFPYIQLPVKLKEENAHCELYVYEKKKVLKSSENLSALLHLDLESLGPTDIYVKLSGTSVYASFSVDNDKSQKIFESEIPSLSDALGKRGYTLSSDVKLQEKGSEKPPLVTEFLETHSPSSVTRYSFDMRA